MALPKGSGTILVADDEPDVVSVAARILKLAGYTMISANDSPSTVEALRTHPEVRLVLLDLGMPGGTGAMTIGRLQELRPEVPILVMTGSHLDDTRSHLAGREVAGLLEKPFRPPKLVARIRRALGEDE